MDYASDSAGILYTFSQTRPNFYGGSSTVTLTKLVPTRSQSAITQKTHFNLAPRPKQTLNYGTSFLVPHNQTQSFSTYGLTTSTGTRSRSRYSSNYDSINDPHLQDYFERKFGLSSAKHTKTKKLTGRSLLPHETIYKIKVKTGPMKYASTDANVFITLVGKSGQSFRHRLFKKDGAIGTKYKFDRASTNLFRLYATDVGIISFIIIEHDGTEVSSSWFLENIHITNTKTKKTCNFECNEWLSLHHGLYRTKIQLFPSRLKDRYTETDYEVVVLTGDRQFAGTDANVYITLFGRKLQSERIKLESKNEDKNLFERGKIDTFKVHAKYVGQLRKIRIEHDNTGKSPGWFLERVVVTDLKDTLKTKYFCVCKRWLAKDEDDGLISRDLEAYSDALDVRLNAKYKITVFTGDKLNAGTDANVSLRMFGTLGESDEWKLDNSKNNFERNMKDEFVIETASLGEIQKILIGHDNKGLNAGWFLDKVIIDDLTANKVYEFVCNRWLARDEADGSTYVTLYPGISPLDGELFTIIIKTGDKKSASTSARVYAEFIGKNKKTSERIIFKDGRFKENREDTFTINLPLDITLPLSKVILGHDSSGSSPNWFCDELIVDCPAAGLRQVFPCEKWLSKNKDDGLTERVLSENLSKRTVKKAKSTWFFWIHTSAEGKTSGKLSKLKFVLYGSEGKTDDIDLNNSSGDMFKQGACDTLKTETEQIGKPYKIRVESSGTLNLDRIEAENQQTKERYVFKCSQSFDADNLIREIAAEGPGIKRKLDLKKYEVEVHTGNERGGGTDANVFINILGDLGDTGERPLKRPLKKNNPFERKSIDTFHLEAIDLKELRKIRIGHDNSGAQAGWFLAKVLVRELDGKQTQEKIFECNRWLAKDEDDGAIVRELSCDTTSDYLDKTSFNVSIKTGDIKNAGTDANVHLKIFGSSGETDVIRLKNAENNVNKFERGLVDLFKIEHEDIGKIEKIRIGHDGKGVSSGWFLDYVHIEVPSQGLRYIFSTHRWLDEKEKDGKTEIELEPTEIKKIRKLTPYVVVVKTGKQTGAGTDADVFIQMYGVDGGKTEEIYLDNKSDNFERGNEDKFKVEAEDIGQIFKLRVGHNNKGANSAWFCEEIIIQKPKTRTTSSRPSSRPSSRASLRSSTPDVEEYYFKVNNWLSRTDGDKQLVREVLATDAQGNPLFDLNELTYTVKVYTGDKRGAGTDANVYVTIYGTFADSGERHLKDSENANKFERNQVDTFDVKAIELGELQKLRIRHDNKGGGAAWYLEKIEITDQKNGRTYLFNCQNWLSTSDGDGKISRELPALDLSQAKKVSFRPGVNNLRDQILLETEALTTTYNIYVTTSDIRGAGTDANVFIQLFGDKLDSGKLPLETSKSNKNKFERGQTDLFEIKESDVGDLRKIRLGHDGTGMGSGWHLEKVIIDIPKLGKKYTFPCGRWFDSGEDDGKIERDLEPSDLNKEEYMPCVNYEIVVYTSDIKGADTTANPYIVLYGREIYTRQVNLCKSKLERKDKFKRGSIDRFVLELEDVGKIEKIRLGHDNTGMFAGWHVDKVEIRRLKTSGKGSYTYVFNCKRWLARDEDDKAIERDLIASKILDEKLKDGELQSKEKLIEDKLEMKIYKVEVTTGDVTFAGTNANVFLTIYGDQGDSGEKKLVKSETHTDKFERNQTDVFKVETADLGNITHIRIRHDDAGISADWFLDRVVIRDDKQKYTFLCERWLSTSREDKKIERVIYEKNYTGPRAESSSTLKSTIGGSISNSRDLRSSSLKRISLENINESPAEGPTIPYTVVLKTGAESNAGTTAQVFIRIVGRQKKDTGRIKLQLAKRKKFEPGSTETFSIDALDVDDIRKIEIGHDGVAPGSGWLLKEIEIHTPIKGRSYFININEWLAVDKGDGLTTKTFYIDEANTKISEYKNLIPYMVTFVTGDVKGAGTDSSVTLKVFGTDGQSSDILVEKLENRFERDSRDDVKVELDDIGKLKKIRVSHDAKGARKEWFLDRVEMTNMITNKNYLFECGEWLKATKPVDIALSKGGKKSIDTTSYRLTIKTSDLSGAGTDANVSCILFGENGDSGTLELKKSETNFNKFERNSIDIFQFENLLSLGELSKCRIWHDDSGTLFGKAKWHLESVLVEDMNTKKSYMFPCNKWLSLSKDDNQKTRDLTCSNTDKIGTPRVGEKTSYEITVVTSDKKDAGTTQNAWIALVGDRDAISKQFVLENSSSNKILRRSQTDQFIFKSKSVGELCKIVLGHVERDDAPLRSREGREASWHCSQVIIRDTSTDTTYNFQVESWIHLDQDGKVFDLAKKDVNKVAKTRELKQVKYKILVITGDVKGAGTDANVSVTLFGTNGDSGPRRLDKSWTNLFERNQTDEFTVECLDLGELQKLRVEHDNSSFKKSWFLDRIEVVNETSGEKIVFPCGKWLDKSKDDGEIARDLFPIQARSTSRASLSKDEGRNSKQSITHDRQRTNSSISRQSTRETDTYSPRPTSKDTRGSRQRDNSPLEEQRSSRLVVDSFVRRPTSSGSRRREESPRDEQRNSRLSSRDLNEFRDKIGREDGRSSKQSYSRSDVNRSPKLR